MRKTVLIIGVVVASLGLSACGAGTKATIDSSVASLGAQSDVQVHFTASVAGADTAQAQKVLSVISMDTDYATTNGDPLSQAGGKTNGEVTFNVDTKPILDLRAIDSNLYVEIDLSAVNQIPGLPLTSQDQSEVGALQLFLDGKWFEIPSKLITSEIPKSTPALKAKAAQDQAIERKIFDALTKLIDNGHAKALASGGYSESGTLESVVKALLPTISGLIPEASSVGHVPGTYTLTLTNAGSVATGGSVSITAPEGSGSPGNATVTLKAAITHNSVSIGVPANVTVITPALIQQLEGSASSV